MTRPLVYVAGPITGDPWGCVRKAVEVAETLSNAFEFDAYLPQLSVLHEIVSSQPYESWMTLGLNMVGRCDGLYRIPGWSPGAAREVAHARSLDLPVFVAESEWIGEWVTEVRAQHNYRLESAS